MESRKEELQKEMDEIRSKEIETQLKKEEEIGGSVAAIDKAKESEAIRKERAKDNQSHHFVMKGDFVIKFLIAFTISGAFFFSAIVGVQSESQDMSGGGSGFAVLSILGPLFGAMLQYYFGKTKAGANGE